MTTSTCPSCGSTKLYESFKHVSAGGGHAPNYLPGLGGMLVAERFKIRVCAECGLTSFFARRSAREKLAHSKKWTRV